MRGGAGALKSQLGGREQVITPHPDLPEPRQHQSHAAVAVAATRRARTWHHSPGTGSSHVVSAGGIESMVDGRGEDLPTRSSPQRAASGSAGSPPYSPRSLASCTCTTRPTAWGAWTPGAIISATGGRRWSRRLMSSARCAPDAHPRPCARSLCRVTGCRRLSKPRVLTVIRRNSMLKGLGRRSDAEEWCSHCGPLETPLSETGGGPGGRGSRSNVGRRRRSPSCTAESENASNPSWWALLPGPPVVRDAFQSMASRAGRQSVISGHPIATRPSAARRT